MSLCVIDGGHCCCQPEDGVTCHAADALKQELAALKVGSVRVVGMQNVADAARAVANGWHSNMTELTEFEPLMQNLYMALAALDSASNVPRPLSAMEKASAVAQRQLEPFRKVFADSAPVVDVREHTTEPAVCGACDSQRTTMWFDVTERLLVLHCDDCGSDTAGPSVMAVNKALAGSAPKMDGPAPPLALCIYCGLETHGDRASLAECATVAEQMMNHHKVCPKNPWRVVLERLREVASGQDLLASCDVLAILDNAPKVGDPT